MAIVGTCTYDTQHQLIRPDRVDIGLAKIEFDLDTGGSPTFERDHVHVHIVTASGLTSDQARQRANAHLARFFERAEAVTGYRKIATSKTQGLLACNGNVAITYEILYAVEVPKWARSHSRASPDAGNRRGRGAAAHG